MKSVKKKRLIFLIIRSVLVIFNFTFWYELEIHAF